MKTSQIVEEEDLQSSTRIECRTKWFSFSGALSMIVVLLLNPSGMLKAADDYGQLWGMGNSEDGQLGSGAASGNQLTPKLIDAGAVAVAAGRGSVYIKADGTLMGMGSNGYGQLGDGTTTDRQTPIVIDTDVIAVSAGHDYYLYIKSDGTLMGVGDNSTGQLGDGTTSNRHTPIVIDIDVVAIVGGNTHSLYVKSDGTLMGMGHNGYGQLGDGTTTDRRTPIVIDSGVVAVAVSWYHSVYVKADGTLMGMGWNGLGQLGDGTTTDKHTPIVIDSDVVAVSAAGGGGHTLYIKSDGTLMGVGSNWAGQLGDGTSENSRHTPIEIDSHVVAVAARMDTSLYVKSDGTLMGMGENHDGELGDGTHDINRLTPIAIDTGVFAVAAGTGHSLYLKIAPLAPVLEILQPPQSYTAEPGSSATFTVTTGGIAGETFEWKHGDTVVGGDSATLTLFNVQASDAGQYTVTVSAGGETVSSRAVTLGVKAPPYTEKMMNISTRGQILEGFKVMIAGFVLEGSGKKDVLIRGIGPTLGQWVTGVCTDPKLTLFRNTSPATPSIAENEAWGSLSVDLPSIRHRVGAFVLTDGSKDAVLYMNLDPGAYTAKVSGMDGTGVGLVELYDADLDPLASTCTLSNISTRGEVGTQAQILIAGFVIAGEVPMQVLVRGIGPRLADFDVDGTLPDPYLRIYKNATPEALWVASNDNWSGNPNAADIVSISAAVGAFDLVDGSKDAVMLTWLEPGTYTAQVSGVDDGTGVALVEVYEVK